MDNEQQSTMQSSPLVYVVDDMRVLAELAGTILRQDQYEIRVFNNPHDAYAAFKADPLPPELLVTDAEMPSMSGFDLIRLFRQKHPRLKAIVMSGSVDQTWMDAQPVQPDRFLPKPYRPAELQLMARSLLQADHRPVANPV